MILHISISTFRATELSLFESSLTKLHAVMPKNHKRILVVVCGFDGVDSEWQYLDVGCLAGYIQA